MKTIAKIATEIGVSKQAVHKKIKQEPLSTSLQGLTTTKGNTIYVEVDGENLIKTAFNKTKSSISSTTSVDDITSQFIASLQYQIANLTEQNQELRELIKQEREYNHTQANRITELAIEMAQIAENAQKLHAGEMIPKISNSQLRETEMLKEKEKSGLISFLFKRKNK